MIFQNRAVRYARLLFVVIFVFFYCTFSSDAQDSKGITAYERVLRVEIPAKSDNETYRLIPLKDLGLAVFFKSLETVDQEKSKWYFSWYDKDLKLHWTKGIAITNSFVYQDFSLTGDTLSLLYRIGGKDKLNGFNVQIIRLILKKGLFIGNIGKVPENAEILDFSINRQNAYLGYNVKNETAGIMKFNLLNGNQEIYPLTPADISTLTDFSIDTSGTRITVAMRKTFAKNQPCFSLLTIDTLGQHISEAIITSVTGDHVLTSIRFFRLNANDMIAMGSYGQSSGAKNSKEIHYQSETTGIYFTRITDNKQQSILYYNFLELSNINQILGESEMESMKKKASRKNKTLNDYSVNLTMLLHPIIKENNELILVAESFFPQYHTENFTDFDFYGRPFTNTYSIFDGYRFKNAIITGFDFNGKLLWDNSMEIRNLLTTDQTSKVTLYPTGNNIVSTYLSEGKIASKIIRNNEVIEKLDFNSLELGYPNDKLLSETKSRIIPWYQNFFICYGYQEIKNVSLDNNNKRLVFYFNKIKFE